MSQSCRCGDECRTCYTCEHPKCECYCEDFFDDDYPGNESFDSSSYPDDGSDW